MQASSRFLLASGVLLALLVHYPSQSRAELKYAPEVGTTHSYRVEIVAELPDATETLKGVIVYTVKEANAGQVKWEYRGGLNKTRKAKAAAGGGRPGPGGFRRPGRPTPGGPPSPFSTPTFTGLTQTTNQITLSSQGDVLAMKGSSQLPYLLGNLSLFIFESLPEKAEETWKVENGISITETNERTSFPRFGPRRPGTEPDAGGKRTASVETSTYKITKAENNLISIAKTYQLEQPLTDGKGFEIAGQGTWVFDEAKSVPQQLSFRQDVTVHVSNVSVKLPITCNYELMTEEQLAEHRKAQEEQQAEMKARLAQAQEQAQTRRQAPLTAEQKADVLKKLSSDRIGDVLQGMNTLRFKDPQEPDAEIAAALKKLLDHKNRSISRQAEQIAKKWAPKD